MQHVPGASMTLEQLILFALNQAHVSNALCFICIIQYL